MVVNDEIIKDMNLARRELLSEDYSIVVVQDEKILTKKKGDGIKPIMNVIDVLGDELKDTVVGNKILGKASAFLLRYSKVKGVYSLQATKTAIAILIIGGITCQVDEVISFIKNENNQGFGKFEEMLRNVESPEEAYNILKENIIID
jgi:hypothetical protein